VNALVLSGKPAHQFIFAGFLPNRRVARQNRLRELAKLESTLIFYESCHRIQAALEDIEAIFGAKEIVVARELTKKFEEVKRGSASAVQQYFRMGKPRGEFAIVI
jgi:16S rRNA (cytidine1402-2'-O)-methyltransferase